MLRSEDRKVNIYSDLYINKVIKVLQEFWTELPVGEAVSLPVS